MSSSYAVPIVHRTSDPLVIRTSDTSLLVNDTTYNAVVKCGNLFCGFYVYATGHGYPVYQYKDDDLTSSLRGSGSAVTIHTQLEMYAKRWVDDLEEAILLHRSDNELKKAIDRLTWQLHYDITESNTDFVDRFPDFSDISIDMTGHTIYNTVTTSATTLGNAVGDGADVIIGNSDSGAGIWSVSNTISSMSTSVCGKLDTVSNNISTFDSNLNGSSGSIKTYIGNVIYSSGDTGSTPTTLCGYINKVATNIKADSDTYTVSRALRDSGDDGDIKCVAKEIKTGCSGINQTVDSINTSIGTPNNGDSILSNLRTSNQSFTSVTDSIGDVSTANTILGKLAESYTKVNNIDTKIGDYGGDRILGRLKNIDDNTSQSGSIVTNLSAINSNVGTMRGAFSTISGNNCVYAYVSNNGW